MPRAAAADSAEEEELIGLADNDEDTKPSAELESSLRGDYHNVAMLLVLYTLQGIPMGLAGVLPLVLKERNVSFSDLGTFSLCSYPFSLKLLWAPVVDAAYVGSFGRRKTWLVPTQFLIGVVMIGVSSSLDSLLYIDEPCIKILTGEFFLLYFLCATQDIAVDGWALTMLRKENVGYAATTNSIGQTLGYAIGFTGFMVLEEFKITTLSGFMFFWGVVFVVVTACVAMFKSEGPRSAEDEPESVASAYKSMFDILKLRSVRVLAAVLLTWKATFPVADAVAPLKFQDKGIKKEHMAYMASILMPVYILLPAVVSRWTSSSTPFDLAFQAYPWRAALVPLTAVLVGFTPSQTDALPYFFYSLVLLLSFVAAITSQCMFVSQMAFFARVSDPALGGTYMTLLNTLGNLGGKWPPTVAFYLVDALSCKEAECHPQRDGFYVVTAISTGVGLLWCLLGMPLVYRMQRWKLEDWKVR